MKPRYYILTALYCAAIFYLSSKSKPIPMEMPFPGADKLAHFVLFGGLCAIVSIGILRSGKPRSLAFRLIVPIVFTCLYGLTDEFHQLYVPQRSFDPADLAADAAGAVVAQAALFIYWRVTCR